MTSMMATIRAGCRSRQMFSSPLGQGHAEEKASEGAFRRRCSGRGLLIFMLTEGKGAFVQGRGFAVSERSPLRAVPRFF